MDSLRIGQPPPSALGTDSTRIPSGPPVAERPSDSGLKEAVQFSSQDSLVVVFDQASGDEGTLFGNANVKYGDATLSAHQVSILFEVDELRATGLPADTGMVGRPQFQQGQESFSGERLAFNLRTERGRIVGAQTVMEDGFIRGGVVKVTEDSTIYVANGLYTTCECVEDPSYSLHASKMKIVDKEWVYTGPIQLYLFNIPTPLWLPFGFLPAQEGRRSGPLPPQYGEDERGFYLRDWGWYWAINDYLDAQLRLGIWTRGSWQVAPFFRYNRRYRYQGSLQLDYIRNRTGEKGDPTFTQVNTSSLRWNHGQTISPTSNFSSNVNLSSANYLRSISENYDDRVRQTVESSIRYSKRWPQGGRAVNVGLSQRQVLATGQTSLTLPNLSFTQSQRKPFQRDRAVAAGRERWYERITFSYNGQLNNAYNFNPTPVEERPDSLKGVGWWDALLNPSLYRAVTDSDVLFDMKATHSVPVSAAFSMNRLPILNTPFRLNVTSSLSYTEDWYAQTQRRHVDSTNQVKTTREPGFFAFRRFTSGVSANTTFYGLFPWKVGRLNGFRHTVRPNVGLAFSPDYYGDFWGYTRTYTDTSGRVVEYPIIGTTLGRRQQTLTFSIDNVFESKLVRTDSTGEDRSEVLKLLDVDVSGGYNFAADSLKLSNISLSARTNLFNRVDLSFRSTLAPYEVDPASGRILNDYIFSVRDFRLARLERASLSVRTSFRSKNSGTGRPVSDPRARMADPSINPAGGVPPYGAGGALDPYYDTPLGYTDFEIPWSLSLDLSYNYTNTGRLSTDRSRHVANLNTSFDFNLTPNWKVQGRSGIDLIARELVTTTLSVHRDFECWQMSFNWTPFGRYQSYSFDLHVKSGKLRDILRIRQPRADVRGRFAGAAGL